MDPMEYLGNLILLIVGGNDTTRNSISGGVIALNDNPDQYEKLRGNLDLIPNMVSEIIRYQTPLTHMRRTATQDTVLRGKRIRQGDKVVMWYASGNRDEDVIDDPNSFRIDRDNARHHLSFGFGIHRCMGNRLAEMQLTMVWQEIMKRFHTVEIVGEMYKIHYPNKPMDTARSVKRHVLADRLESAGAYTVQSAGWEIPDWYAPEGVSASVEEFGWGRPDWYDHVAEEHRACREDVILSE